MAKTNLKSELTQEGLKFLPMDMYKLGVLIEKKTPGSKKLYPKFEPGTEKVWAGQHFIDAGALTPIEYFEKNPDKLLNKIYNIYHVLPDGKEMYFYESNPSQNTNEIARTSIPGMQSGLNDKFDPEKSFQENQKLKEDLHQKEIESLKIQNEQLKASHSPENINALENYFKESLNFYREENRRLKEQIDKLFEDRISDKGEYEQELSEIKLEYEQKLYEQKAALNQCQMAHKDELYKKEREHQKEIDHHIGLNDALTESYSLQAMIKALAPEFIKNPSAISEIINSFKSVFGKGGNPGVNVNQSNFDPNQYRQVSQVPQNGNGTKPPNMFAPRPENQSEDLNEGGYNENE